MARHPSPPVEVVLEPLLDGAQVHRLLDDLEVVRQAQFLQGICFKTISGFTR